MSDDAKELTRERIEAVRHRAADFSPLEMRDRNTFMGDEFVELCDMALERDAALSELNKLGRKNAILHATINGLRAERVAEFNGSIWLKAEQRETVRSVISDLAEEQQIHLGFCEVSVQRIDAAYDVLASIPVERVKLSAEWLESRGFKWNEQQYAYEIRHSRLLLRIRLNGQFWLDFDASYCGKVGFYKDIEYCDEVEDLCRIAGITLLTPSTESGEVAHGDLE